MGEAMPSVWGWRPVSARTLMPVLGPLGQPLLLGVMLVVLGPLLVAAVVVACTKRQQVHYEELPRSGILRRQSPTEGPASGQQQGEDDSARFLESWIPPRRPPPRRLQLQHHRSQRETRTPE